MKINSVKENHYSPNYLKKALYDKLDSIYTSKELAKIFNRNYIWIQEILSELKREGKVKYTRVKDKIFWARNDIIEKFLLNQKLDLLKAFNSVKTITKLTENINLGPKAVRRRLRALAKENLVRNKNQRWKLTSKGKKLICGIDEAGKKV